MMEIKMRLAITIDPDDWTANYGIEGKDEITKDVESYVTNALYEQLRSSGITATVTAKPLRPPARTPYSRTTKD